MPSKRYFHQSIDDYFSPLDRWLTYLHSRLFPRKGILSILVSLVIYINIILLFGNSLKISCNYFVLLPLIAASFSYGLAGGVIAGFLALPANLLLFSLIGHPEYAPDSLFIAELSGILVGVVMGHMSDFFYKMDKEIQKRRVTEEQLRKTLADKDLLLQEVNHRVRNNLHIIKSLIHLQKNRVEHELFRRECDKLSQRIFSISLIHDQLYREGHSVFIDLREYLSSLLENLLSGAGPLGIRLTTSWPEDDLLIPNDKAVYLGLIVHEVVMNSIKYAFDDVSFPALSLDLSSAGEKYVLSLRDNGGGFDPEATEPGLGTELIRSLCSQMEGHFSFRQDQGTIFQLQFPLI